MTTRCKTDAPDMRPVYPKAGSHPGFADLVHADRGQIDRRLFHDRAIYEAELRQIFGRAWLFLAHESQIPATGDFVRTRMGEDDVIVVRQRDGRIGAYLNSCPHRGNRVCMLDAGRARGFICNYHGWSFGLDGRLTGTDGKVYDEDPDFRKADIGLTPVAQVASYKGLVFGTFDPDAPSLSDWFGPFAWYLDVMLDNDEGGTEFIGGCIRSEVVCNWKLPAENFVGDILHAFWTHQSGAKAVLGGGVDLGSAYHERAFQASVYGHGIETNLDKIGNTRTLGYPELVDYVLGRYEAVKARLGETRARMVGAVSSCTVFPNFSFLPGQATFRVWQPKGPDKIELYTWTLVNRNMPPEIKELYRKGTMLTFSPGGVFEMDDGENWEYATRANEGWVTRHQPLHYALGVSSRIEAPDLPGHVHRGSLNDANQRLFYARWAEFMRHDNWTDLMSAETAPPEKSRPSEAAERTRREGMSR
jgi:ethylbenzene dioxygenase alpha subunit